MKRFPTLTVVMAFTMIISACGAEPVPTVNPVDVQNTAVAAAFTMVAQTQAAIPTATPLPPTEAPTQTPLATNTPLPLPTLEVTLTPVAVANTPGGDPCDSLTKTLTAPDGKPTIIRIINETKVAVTVSIYLNKTAFGECGYRSYKLGKNDDVVITDLVYGCYSLWAWSDDPKGRFQSGGYGCINNSDKWSFLINPAHIKFAGP